MSEASDVRDEVKKFEVWNTDREDVRLFLLQQGPSMTKVDAQYLAGQLAHYFRIEEVRDLERQYGLNLTETWDRTLGSALFFGSTAGPELMTGPDSKIPLKEALSQLLRAGANPARMEQEGFMIAAILGRDPSQVRSGLRQDLDRLARDFPEGFADVERMLERAGLRHMPTLYETPEYERKSGEVTPAFAAASVPSTPSDPLKILRESSGQDWRLDTGAGRVYLNLPKMEDVAKVSTTLSREGVTQSYGGEGFTEEGKTAVIIPEAILSGTPEDTIRRAGEAVKHDLQPSPAPRPTRVSQHP